MFSKRLDNPFAGKFDQVGLYETATVLGFKPVEFDEFWV